MKLTHRLRGAIDWAVPGLLVGSLLGLIDGLLATPFAGESLLQKHMGVFVVDATIGVFFGTLVGFCVGGPHRLFGKISIPVALCLVIAIVFQPTSSSLNAELSDIWTQSRRLPVLRSPEPTGIVVISLDTVRGDVMRTGKMPNLAGRADDALRYSRAHATSSWTLPSMASVHTGLFAHDHLADRGPLVDGRIEPSGLSGVETTLAEWLQSRGFINAAIVTNPFNGHRYGFNRGFDYFKDLSRAALRRIAIRRSSIVRLAFPIEKDDASVVTDEAISVLDQTSGGDFFLWLHYLDAHAPYSSDPGGFDQYDECALPDCFNDWGQVRRGEILAENDRERIRELYDIDLAYLDTELERFFVALDARGLWESTLVLLVADHGEEFWEHGGVEHGENFHGATTQIPFLVWAPGHPGKEMDQSVDLANVMPAIQSWVENGNLGPIEETGNPRVTPMTSLLFGAGVGCTDGFARVLLNPGESGKSYDLKADPEEARNLGTAAFPHLNQCVQDLKGSLNEHGAPIADPAALRALGYIE